jgi:organic hydroperoxide reductase OsmC/OhrA
VAGEVGPNTYSATTTAEGRSGVRRVRIRDFQVITDSKAELIGYDLGPNAPELLLGALSACLNHYFLTHAALLDIPLDHLAVTASATQDPRAGTAGHEDTPFYPFDIKYEVSVDSPASDDRLAELHAAVASSCALSNLLQRANTLTGTWTRVNGHAEAH